MSAVLTPATSVVNSVAESFREPNQNYLSPRRVGEALELGVQSVAERAGVSRNMPTSRPQSEKLQEYLRDVVRVLTAAVFASEGDRNRAIFWFMNEPIPDFDFRTPDDLVRAGKAEAVIDYIESISGGATG